MRQSICWFQRLKCEDLAISLSLSVWRTFFTIFSCLIDLTDNCKKKRKKKGRLISIENLFPLELCVESEGNNGWSPVLLERLILIFGAKIWLTANFVFFHIKNNRYVLARISQMLLLSVCNKFTLLFTWIRDVPLFKYIWSCFS